MCLEPPSDVTIFPFTSIMFFFENHMQTANLSAPSQYLSALVEMVNFQKLYDMVQPSTEVSRSFSITGIVIFGQVIKGLDPSYTKDQQGDL